MKLKELFATVTTDPDFEGFITTDEMVLAVDTTTAQDADVDDFEVAYMGFTDRSSSLNAQEKTSSYYYHGESTVKTGNQRTIDFTAERYKGDPFQDFVTSFEMKYAKGQKAIVRYAYINTVTGEGEIGKASLIMSDDGSGAPEENLSVSGSLKKSGTEPEKLDYQGFGGYTSLSKEPSDWSTAYTSYYTRSDGAFAAVTGDSAPTFKAGTYYSKNEE